MWRVTKSYIEDTPKNDKDFGSDPIEVDVQSCDYEPECEKDLTTQFRMYDDDGMLYYEGKADEDASFEPLDDFGMPNAGCTYIKYYNDNTNEWETV